MGGVGSGPAPVGVPVKVGEAVLRVPKPPADLGPEARATWKRLAPLVVKAGLLTTADLEAFEAMCDAAAIRRQAAALLKAEGLTSSGYKGQPVEHPAVKIERAAAQEFRRWADKFGLTPGSRARLAGAAPHVDAADDLGELAAGPTEL